jgi:hypothetical protein
MLITIERKLVGILMQKLVGILIQKLVGILMLKWVGILMLKFNHHGDYKYDENLANCLNTLRIGKHIYISGKHKF